jgi:hypothetical protein
MRISRGFRLNTDIWPVRSAPAVMGYGAALSVVLAAFTYTGGKLTGYERDPTVDEVSRKEFLRKNRRRPVDEIVNELGEGRGTCWICDAMQSRIFHPECHLLIYMQEFTRPATRSVGHSASRPTTALMFPPLPLRKYVSYTHNTIFHVRRNAMPLGEPNFLGTHGIGPFGDTKALMHWIATNTALIRSSVATFWFQVAHSPAAHYTKQRAPTALFVTNA